MLWRQYSGYSELKPFMRLEVTNTRGLIASRRKYLIIINNIKCNIVHIRDHSYTDNYRVSLFLLTKGNIQSMKYKMRSPIRYLLTLLAITLLFGCATTRNVLYDKTERPAKPDDYKIETFAVAGIHRPYKVIGTVIASTGPFHHVLDAMEHLEDQARRMGGDALIDLIQGLPKELEMPTGGWFIFGSSGEIWSAKVIIWE